MKVKAECVECIISRGLAEARKATTNPALRFRTMVEILRLMSRDFNATAVPAELGTKRDRLIKQITDNKDPYRRDKEKSNQKALDYLPYAREMVEKGYTQQTRFKNACLCAIVGNTMEFHIPGHKFDFRGLKKLFREAEENLIIDETDKIYRVAKKAKEILYLTDNAGEIVFDTLLVEQLKNMGITVTVGVKGHAVLNDATLEDTETSGIDKIADKIVTTGTDAIGLAPKEFSEDFLNLYHSVDMVFAKGMGYAETLTEYKLEKPHALLFRTKCKTVADFFAVPREKNVAKMM